MNLVTTISSVDSLVLALITIATVDDIRVSIKVLVERVFSVLVVAEEILVSGVDGVRLAI